MAKFGERLHLPYSEFKRVRTYERRPQVNLHNCATLVTLVTKVRVICCLLLLCTVKSEAQKVEKNANLSQLERPKSH